MAQQHKRGRPHLAAPTLAGVPSLTLEEARKSLHELASQFRLLTEPSDSLVDRAVAVGPHRKGGLVLIPEVDVRAALDALEQRDRELAALEDDLEVFGMMLLADERLMEPTPADELVPVDALARRFGLEKLLAD